MNKEQFKHFRRERALPTVPGVQELTDRTPRTLLYGYNKNWATLHVYIGQDGLIHVLLHAPLRDETGPGSCGVDFLVLQHTFGVNGGQSYPEGYVPSERVFPEFSDFQFCTLLEDCGVNLPFAPFREDVALSQDYHGATLEHGISERGLDLRENVQGHSRFPKRVAEPDLFAYRLIRQAAIETKSAYADLGLNSQTYVAASRKALVLRKVDAYLFEMSEKNVAHLVVEDLVASVFGQHRNVSVSSRSDFNGCLMFSVVAPRAVSFGETLVRYDSPDPCYASKKFSGTYRDRPFVIDTMGEDNGVYRVYFSRFGDPVQFGEDMLADFVAAQTA